jgi:1-acyl-sn-glycerol-3-phosphate acyltransferase
MPQPAARPTSFLTFLATVWLNFFIWLAVPLLALLFLLVGAPLVLIFLLIVRNRRRTKWLIRRWISNYGAVVLRCGWPFIRIKFVDHAQDAKPPFLFVSNHRSSSDPFLMAFLPFECIQVLSNWPSKIPVFGAIAALAGYLKIRQMPFEAFIHRSSALLAEGVSIIMFPEGTRSGSARLGSFHGTAFRLAQQTGVSIVPIAISGNEHIPKRGSIILRPGRIVISKLPPLTREEYAQMGTYQLKTLVREKIQRELETH